MYEYTDHQSDTITQNKTGLAKVPLYAVIMHNDHYTTMDFVVAILLEVFAYTLDRAVNTMMQIHEQGQAVVATLPKEIAEMKADHVMHLAQEADFPLLVTVQKCD